MKPQTRIFFSTNLLAGHSWKFMLLQAVVAILLGIFFMVHYASALFALAILLGVMLVASGVEGFVLMGMSRRFKFGLAIYSLFWIMAGLVLVVNPFFGASVLILALGIWFIFHALELFTGAALDRIHTPGFRILVAVNGLVTLAFGIVIATVPLAVAGVLNWLFAFFLIFYGAVTLGVALRFRKISRTVEPPPED